MPKNSLETVGKIEKFKGQLLGNENKLGQLIPLLQSAQDTYGFIPELEMHYISEVTGIPPAEIYGVITFYAQFRLKPLGKNVIKICEGTACHVNGVKKIVSALQNELNIGIGETTDDNLFSLQSVACLGCCSLAPVMMVNDETYGNLTSDKIAQILKKYRIN
ncbi:MAG: NADH-quinone oxidoreductase subunit NuoE [Candidatus Cloacimonetes bacterium]|nr:NADH-quinone oxidoreductase subunit NuoE [Candidatus Cloacimonadota bacterium]